MNRFFFKVNKILPRETTLFPNKFICFMTHHRLIHTDFIMILVFYDYITI
jgi:hypothetical protein